LHYKLKLNITYLQTFLLRLFLGKLGKIKLQCLCTLFSLSYNLCSWPVHLTSLSFSLSHTHPPTAKHSYSLSLSLSQFLVEESFSTQKEWNVSAASWSYLRTRLHGFSLYLCSTLNFKEIEKEKSHFSWWYELLGFAQDSVNVNIN